MNKFITTAIFQGLAFGLYSQVFEIEGNLIPAFENFFSMLLYSVYIGVASTAILYFVAQIVQLFYGPISVITLRSFPDLYMSLGMVWMIIMGTLYIGIVSQLGVFDFWPTLGTFYWLPVVLGIVVMNDLESILQEVEPEA